MSGVSLCQPNKSRVLAIVVCVLTILTSLSVAAADSVQTLNERMTRLFAQKRYQRAIPLATKLYQRTKNPAFLATIGRCYDLLKQDEQALIYYRRYLSLQPSTSHAQRVIVRVAVLRTRYALTKREVTVISRPQGAELFLGDAMRPLGKTPVTLWIPFGRIRLRFLLGGYKPLQRVVTIGSGPSLTIDQPLERIATHGVLLVKSNVPQSRVSLNGKDLGITPLRLRLKAGRYRLKVWARNWQPYSETVEIVADRTEQVSALLLASVEKVPREARIAPRVRIGAWIGLGSGVAMLGVSLGVYLWSRKSVNDVTAQVELAEKTGTLSQPLIDKYNADYARARTRNRWAIGFLAAGSAVALTSSILLIVYRVRKPKPASTSWRWHPLLLPGGGGVHVQLRY